MKYNARLNLLRIKVPSRSHSKEHSEGIASDDCDRFPSPRRRFAAPESKYGGTELPQRFLVVAAKQRTYLDLKKPRSISIHPEGKKLLTSPLSVTTDHPH